MALYGLIVLLRIYSLTYMHTAMKVESCCDSKPFSCLIDSMLLSCEMGVPRQQPHRHSGLATLPSVGAVP